MVRRLEVVTLKGWTWTWVTGKLRERIKEQKLKESVYLLYKDVDPGEPAQLH